MESKCTRTAVAPPGLVLYDSRSCHRMLLVTLEHQASTTVRAADRHDNFADCHHQLSYRISFSKCPSYSMSSIAQLLRYTRASCSLEVGRISASVSVSAPNADKRALSGDIRFRPRAVVPHSVHFRFRRATVGKFGGCRKWGLQSLSCRGRECARRRESLTSLCTD